MTTSPTPAPPPRNRPRKVRGALPILALLFSWAFAVMPSPSSANAPVDEEVTLPLPGGQGRLAGTLTRVPGADTLVVMIAGSGPTDRDGNQPHLHNDSLRLVADGLSGLGVATLRFDKRGSGRSVVNGFREEDVRLETYADDAAQWLRQMRKEGGYRRVGLLGHSEGGLVASLVAAELAPDFVILLETPGRPMDQVLKAQLARKLPPELSASAATLIDALKAGRRVPDVPEPLRFVFRTGVQPYWISVFAHSPAELVGRLDMPLLILQGDKDLQVGVADAQQLVKARPEAAACLVEGMNHVLKTVAEGADQTTAYTDPKLPLSDEVMRDIAAFLATLGAPAPGAPGVACRPPIPGKR